MDNRDSAIESIRFGLFELELSKGELRKRGVPVRLRGQPFTLLALLAQRPDQVVSREEIREALWGTDTFVDFERGINFCVNQIRSALKDDARRPRYIETVAGTGYRFVCPAELVHPNSNDFDSANVSGETIASSPEVTAEVWVPHVARITRDTRSHRISLLFSAAIGVVLLMSFSFYSLSRPPEVTAIKQISQDGATKVPLGFMPPKIANDGLRVYFSEIESSHWISKQVSTMGGEAARLAAPFENGRVSDISPSGSDLLLLNSQADGPLWMLPIPGGPAQPLNEVLAHDAAWSADGQTIVYAKDYAIYTTATNGSNPHRIASFDRVPLRPRWSPDQKRLRFTLHDPRTNRQSLWEVLANGTNLRPVFAGNSAQRDECCGIWTRDGRYFVYQSTSDGVATICAVRDGGGLLGWMKREPVSLTRGPMSFLGPSISPDGKQIFATGYQARGELMRYDHRSGEFVTYLGGISAEGLDFSRDGAWLAYVTYPEGALWRCSVDGTGCTRLTPPGVWASLPRWSADSKEIVFTGRQTGEFWKAFRVSAKGGALEQMIEGSGPEFDAALSADGTRLVYAESVAAKSPKLHIVELRNHRDAVLFGSEGLFSPRWSPNGSFIAALTVDSKSLRLFDTKKQCWQTLLQGRHVSYPSWSRDGSYLYFCSVMEKNGAFYRVRVTGHKPELVADITIPRGLAPGVSGWWTGFTPDNSPLLLRDTGIEEIYALNVDWR